MMNMEKLKKLSGKHLLFILLFILIGVIFPIYYISLPLHFDESTFLAIGAHIRNGSLLYRDVSDIKTPGIFYLAALVFTVAGKSFIAARILTYFVNAVLAILIFFIGKKVKDKNVGMIASILFSIGAYLPLFQGYYYMTEQFALIFILISFLFFLRDGYHSKFISGLFLGMGVLFKQTTILIFGMFFLFYLLRIRFQKNRTSEYVISSVKNLVVIFSGLAVPLLITFTYFFIMGAANEMLYYTVFFVSEYGLPFSLTTIISGFFSYIPVILLSLCMVFVVGYRFLWGKIVDDKHFLLVLWMILFSIPALTIFLDHRVLFVIPPFSILAGIILYDLYKNLKRKQSSNNVKVIIITILLVTTGISLGTNAYFLPANYGVDDQIKEAQEIEQYVEGKVYAFASSNSVLFFSNLTTGVTYLGGIFSSEITENVTNDLQVNNINFIIADIRAINILEKREFIYNPTLYDFIFDYIQEHYEFLTTTDNYIIYRLKG